MFWRRQEEVGPEAPSPYQAFVIEEMILRDHLAVDRTSLANERTLLAYLRTALGCVIGGASALHFLGGLATDLVGVGLILLGLLTAVFGSYRFRWHRRRIEALHKKSNLPPRPLPGSE